MSNPNILDFEANKTNKDSSDDPESFIEPTIQKTNVGKFIGFAVVSMMVIAIPVGRFIFSSQGEEHPRNTRTTLSQSVSTAAQPTFQRRPVDGLNIDAIVGSEGRSRINDYPKTNAELARESELAALQAAAEQRIKSKEEAIRIKEQELDEQIAIVKIVNEDLARTVQLLNSHSVRLNDTSERLQNSAVKIEEAAKGNSLFANGGGVVESIVQNPKLTDYHIRSIVGDTALLSITSRPGEYLKLKIGSVVPGYGEVTSITSQNGKPAVTLSSGHKIGL